MGHCVAHVRCLRGATLRFAPPRRPRRWTRPKKRKCFVVAKAPPPAVEPRQQELKVSILDKTIDALNTKTAPIVGSVGLLVLGVAVVQTVQRLLKLKRENGIKSPASSRGASSSSGSRASTAMPDQPILFSEMEAKLMSPLLLAAETSAEVDETSTMSVAELEDLEVTLRTLLSGMDAQLEELKYDVLDQGLIPAEVLEAIDSLDTDVSSDAVDPAESTERPEMGAAWREFQLFQGYISDQERRSFRSLLYNRSVQLKLLDQVERQIEVKKCSSSATSGADGSGGDSGKESFDRLNQPGDLAQEAQGEGQLFYAAGATAPHALKKARGGEDAFFVNSVAMTMGIADGVGGWERLGIDPGAYSRDIMAHCEAIGAGGNASCMHILREGFERTTVEGSCTLILAKYLAMEGRLDVVSVGDCSMRLVRAGEVIFKTDVQEHAWNQPFQLSHPQFNRADTPDDALEFSFQVVPGDIIVLGSDGLWDNMWDSDLLEAISASDAMRKSYDGSGQWQKEAQELAQRLLEVAEAHSLDEAFASPFAQERDAVRRQSQTFLTRLTSGLGLGTGTPAQGGKQDDISVVCAIIG